MDSRCALGVVHSHWLSLFSPRGVPPFALNNVATKSQSFPHTMGDSISHRASCPYVRGICSHSLLMKVMSDIRSLVNYCGPRQMQTASPDRTSHMQRELGGLGDCDQPMIGLLGYQATLESNTINNQKPLSNHGKQSCINHSQVLSTMINCNI